MYLAPLHTFGLPSYAHAFLTINATTDLQAQLSGLADTAFYILGEGSNTVFLEDYLGTVVNPAFLGIDLDHTQTHYRLIVGAAESWHQLVIWCMRHKIFGLENLALIPGTVGAAPIQNIGAYGVEVERFIHQVDYYDLTDQQHKSLDNLACEFTYRDSVFKKQLANQAIITRVVFDIPKKWHGVTHYGELQGLREPDALDIFKKVIEVRQSKLPDPAKIGNAGSFFKNPVIDTVVFEQLKQRWPSIPGHIVNDEKIKIPAGWLIDQLGFKGKKVGGIGCHPHQALVLTNDGSGNGEQLLQLARQIKTAVLAEFGIILQNEVQLIASKGPIIL